MYKSVVIENAKPAPLYPVKWRPFNGADATCVKIATDMKKCSRLKEISNFNVPWKVLAHKNMF